MSVSNISCIDVSLSFQLSLRLNVRSARVNIDVELFVRHARVLVGCSPWWTRTACRGGSGFSKLLGVLQCGVDPYEYEGRAPRPGCKRKGNGGANALDWQEDAHPSDPPAYGYIFGSLLGCGFPQGFFNPVSCVNQ